MNSVRYSVLRTVWINCLLSCGLRTGNKILFLFRFPFILSFFVVLFSIHMNCLVMFFSSTQLMIKNSSDTKTKNKFLWILIRQKDYWYKHFLSFWLKFLSFGFQLKYFFCLTSEQNIWGIPINFWHYFCSKYGLLTTKTMCGFLHSVMILCSYNVSVMFFWGIYYITNKYIRIVWHKKAFNSEWNREPKKGKNIKRISLAFIAGYQINWCLLCCSSYSGSFFGVFFWWQTIRKEI